MSFGSRKEKAKNIIEDKEYRDFYTEAYLKKSIPFQMRTMRTERGWSQTLAGEILGKGQNAISRLESPAYGKLTLQTLIEIAKGYDVGLVIKFVPYSKLLKEYEDVSFDALSAPSPTEKFKDEIEAIWKWADEKEDGGFWEEETETGEQKSEAGTVTTAKTPSKYATEVVNQLTITLSEKTGLPIQLDNKNKQGFGEVHFSQQHGNNATQFATA